MKNRISVLFSVILGALLITSCSNVFQPNKKVADIEIKASLSGTMARDITGSSSTEDDYSFIDDKLASSDDASENEILFAYYQIIQALMGDYNLSEDDAYNVLADKMFENYAAYGNYWIQISTNLGQESEKVYPFAKQVDSITKQMDSIKSGYKAAIKTAYLYYSFLEEAEIPLSDGQPDYEALWEYAKNNPDAAIRLTQLSDEYTAALSGSNSTDYNFNLTTVSLKLDSVPFDQKVTFTLLVKFDSDASKGPDKYEFTRFVNPGLNVFDILPNELQPSSDNGSGGDDGQNDDNNDSDSTTPVEEPDPDPVVEPDPDVVDPWADYLTYYVSNTAAVTANGLEDDPMSLTAAFDKCREKMYEGTNTKFAIILKDDITISATLTVPESAYIVITGNYDDSIKTIQAGEGFENQLFSIDNYANLGLSSVILQGNGKCLLFYCSHSVNEGDLETDPLSLTGTLTMENCTVTNFAGNTDSGIITMATGGKMTINGCSFMNNYVLDAGAVYIKNGTLDLNTGNLLDSTLDSLTTINTNSFADVMNSNIEATTANPCEIYLKGNGYFNDTNKFLNPTLYAVHTAGYTHLKLDGTYYSGTSDTTPLRIYSTTDGSTAESEDCINTITVDSVDNVSITEGGDNDENTEDQTYEINVYIGV